MSLSEKLLGGPVFRKFENGPADRLSRVGLLIATIGIALCGLTSTSAIILDMAGHHALSQQLVATLDLYPFVLVLLGIVVVLVLPHFIYKNVDPLATP